MPPPEHMYQGLLLDIGGVVHRTSMHLAGRLAETEPAIFRRAAQFVSFGDFLRGAPETVDLPAGDLPARDRARTPVGPRRETVASGRRSADADGLCEAPS